MIRLSIAGNCFRYDQQYLSNESFDLWRCWLRENRSRYSSSLSIGFIPQTSSLLGSDEGVSYADCEKSAIENADRKVKIRFFLSIVFDWFDSR
jgi:hypothetical protein